MAEYHTLLWLNGTYSVDATLLQDIVERANAFLEEEVEITIGFSGVHQLASKNLSDLLQDSLMRTDLITSIDIDGRNHDVKPTRWFHFQARGSAFSPTISVDIWGSNDACRSLSTHIEGLFRAKRQWYPRMVPSPTLPSIMAMILIIGSILVGVPLGAAYVFRPSSIQLVLIILATGNIGWIMLFLWLLRYVFPPLIVEIGRSAEIASRKRGIQKFIFGGVLLALMIGIAASLVANYLSK